MSEEKKHLENIFREDGRINLDSEAGKVLADKLWNAGEVFSVELWDRKRELVESTLRELDIIPDKIDWIEFLDCVIYFEKGRKLQLRAWRGEKDE